MTSHIKKDELQEVTTKPGGKHPSASASKSTSRPAGKSLDEYPPNAGKKDSGGQGKGNGASGR
ncbi:hypothetical protein HKX48_005743 [Thoreauomyces humboldtii]|nr:hypothetical protein HKX48_005743 [Thoreauomyces humboldtii]